MWGLVVELGLWAGLYLYSYLTRPKAQEPKPQTRDNLQLPRTDEDTPIPYVFGRTRVQSPILAWTSQLHTIVVDNANNGAQYIVYGLDMLFVVGTPLGTPPTNANRLGDFTPRLYAVYAGDYRLPTPGTGFLPSNAPSDQYNPPQCAFSDSQFVVQESALGGPGAGGGYLGTYTWFPGCTDQNFDVTAWPVGVAMSDDGLDPNKGPGYRRMMCCSFTNSYFPPTFVIPNATTSFPQYDHNPGAVTGHSTNGRFADVPQPRKGFVLGENASIPGFAFEVAAYGNGLFAMTKPGVDFGGDADPVEVIYDILTNEWARLGIDASKIDAVSFLAASTTLKAENHGISDVYYQFEDAAQMLTRILKQIDATLYEEPTTGLITIKLIRNDYNVSAIPSFTPDNIKSIDDYSMTTFRDTPNEVRVRFTERGTQYKTGIAVAGSLANAVGNGNRRRVVTIDYPGCTNITLARTLAARDLNVVSRPLAKLTITVDRAAMRIRPGSVFKVTWPEYGLTNVVFRAGDVDLGQLFSNQIKINAVQDAFASTYQGYGLPRGTFSVAFPYPLTTRLVTESPRWLAQDAANAGLITDVDVPHVLALAPASTNASTYELRTEEHQYPTGIFGTIAVPSLFLQDIKQQDFPGTFTCLGVDGVNKYPRTLEPYDTATGLVVTNVILPSASTFSVPFAFFSAAHDDIAFHGRTLICVVDTTTGEHEFMAFESVTSLGGSPPQYRLNKVWRGLLDTPPLDHLVGAQGFLVPSTMVSRRGWSKKKPIDVWMVPKSFLATGSGGDPIDVLTLYARAACPPPPADQGVKGEMIYGGVQGTTANGRLKSATWGEEGFDFYGTARDRLSPTIRRGDEAADTLTDFSAVSYFTIASPSGRYGTGHAVLDISGVIPTMLVLPDTHPLWCDGAFNPSGIANAAALGSLGWQVEGYGNIGLGFVASRFVLPGDPLNGVGGITYNDAFTSWRAPLCTLYLPPWRNLIANPRWNINNGTNAVWHDNTGTSSVSSGSFSLSRASSGASSYYLATASTTCNTAQQVAIWKWNPVGLTAYASAYFRNENADANDTANLKIKCSHGTGIGSTGASAPPTATWKRYAATLVIPSDAPFTNGSGQTTCFIELQGELVEVATGGTAAADSRMTEACLRLLNNPATTNGLTNYSFDTGSTSSWTVDTGAFSVATTIASASTNYAQGGAAASSTMHQDYTLPTGYDYNSTAIVELFMASTLANDTGNVTISAVDGGGSVISSTSLGAQSFATLNIWKKNVVYFDLPEATAKVRVTLTATRTLGSGSSGACFDEVVLIVCKGTEERYKTTLDFSTPPAQLMPDTWQSYFLDFPSNPQPSHVFGGTGFNGEEMHWNDSAIHNPGKLVGQFGGGISSVLAYTSTRQNGALAACPTAGGLGQSTLGAYTSASTFSALAYFRVDEATWGGVAGICGRANLSLGWGLRINASGYVEAFMRGAGATSVSVNTGRSVVDGALHMAALAYDPVADLLWVFDEVGGASVSTAALGEITVAATSATFRLCRASDDQATLPGMLGRVYLWDTACITSAQALSHWVYGDDPTGLVTTYTRSAPAWVPCLSDSAGVTIAKLSTSQIAIPYWPNTGNGASLTADGGTGFGLAYGEACANAAPTFDFTDATHWTIDSGPGISMSTGVQDATGRLTGCTFVSDTTHGLNLSGITGASGTVLMALWMRASVNAIITTPIVDVNIYNSSSVLKSSSSVQLSQQWQMVLASGTWDNSTGTFTIKLVSDATNGGNISVDVTGFGYIGCNTLHLPAIFPDVNSSFADYNVEATVTLPVTFNSEGEIAATGILAYDLPASVGSIANVINGSDNKNRRELAIKSTGAVRCATWDATPTEVDADSGVEANIQNSMWTARARWSRAQLLDALSIGATSTPFSTVAYGDTHPTAIGGTTGRSAVFTMTTTQATKVQLGKGSGTPSDVVLRSLVLRAGPSKL